MRLYWYVQKALKDSYGLVIEQPGFRPGYQMETALVTFLGDQ